MKQMLGAILANAAQKQEGNAPVLIRQAMEQRMAITLSGIPEGWVGTEL